MSFTVTSYATSCQYNCIMLDGLVLQVVLTALVIISAIIGIVWFVCGLNRKSAVWIVACAVPVAVGIAVLIAIL